MYQYGIICTVFHIVYSSLCQRAYMVAGARFELANDTFKACCVTTSPPSNKLRDTKRIRKNLLTIKVYYILLDMSRLLTSSYDDIQRV